MSRWENKLIDIMLIHAFICTYFSTKVFNGFEFRGKKFVELPYTVKGMDVSFSGILSYIEVRTFGIKKCHSNLTFLDLLGSI